MSADRTETFSGAPGIRQQNDQQKLKNKSYVTALSAPIRKIAYPDRQSAG
jgi:hypothetical protein